MAIDVFPNGIKLKAEEITSSVMTLRTRTVGGNYKSYAIPSHHWKMKLTTVPITRAQARALFAFLMAQDGGNRVFTIGTTTFKTPLGVATGTPVVSGTQTAGATSVLTTGWTNSTTGILKAGDFVQFASHPKVYMVVDDTNSSGAGVSTLNIRPALVATINNGETVKTTDIKMTVTTARSQETITAQGGNPYYQIDLELEEVYNA